MTAKTVVTYYWRVWVQGHLSTVYVMAVDLSEARAKAERIGQVLEIQRLMPVKKGRAKGYSFPTTFWREDGKVKDETQVRKD